ncbi:MAG: hypothetical protein KGH93_02210 [Patescibacteria group bacterium]|nr:hypothetical protein [Patescibacteria group bacterium]MDE1945991.1 hypothetical protein [Patescibacteria group bacterium]
MFTVKRSPHNPIISPNTEEPWEGKATFNWCPIRSGRTIHAVYRAMSATETYFGTSVSISSIGYAKSMTGTDFKDRRQLVFPEYAWERYGCEDPRVCFFEGNYYIFYTALENYPYNADGIKVAVAVTKDFRHISAKHIVTPFNAKAMVLFPERIEGKIVAILSVDTDRPPHEKICFAEFDRIEEIWDEGYWRRWYAEVDTHVFNPRRFPADHIEVGAPPLKTKDGWLFVHSYIENYRRENNPFQVVFGTETLLLDLENPMKILGRTRGPIFSPTEVYEREGQVKDVIFPSGALLTGDMLDIYYGGADTYCCKASVRLDNLLFAMRPDAMKTYMPRYFGNPILGPRPGVLWEKHGVFNPAAIRIDGTTHIIYRAMSDDFTSTFGYAATHDGFTIAERDNAPVYLPREPFEMKTHPGNSGCEDPRLTRIGDVIYMCYTAYDGSNPPRVALTSIYLEDFLAKRWNWTKPFLISPPGIDDKDACVFPEKIGRDFLILHRVNSNICADGINELDFRNLLLTRATPIMMPRQGAWDGDKVGLTAPPIKTEKGWLMLYHGVSSNHHTYRLGIALLDKKDPRRIVARANAPIFEPDEPYEKAGEHVNVVFPCGAVLCHETLFVYYGGADDVVGVATVPIKRLLDSLL